MSSSPVWSPCEFQASQGLHNKTLSQNLKKQTSKTVIHEDFCLLISPFVEPTSSSFPSENFLCGLGQKPQNLKGDNLVPLVL